MKRKLLIIIYIILIIIVIKLLYNIIANSILLSNYNSGKYDEEKAEALTHFNFQQSYVAHYNYGNVFYKNKEYESAIEEYKKALEKRPPKEKICSVRINYALAICKTVEVDESDEESINNAIKTYESAIDVLTEEGCANKNDNDGHSKKAEQLKKDIQKEIDRLKNLKQEESSSSSEKEDEQEEGGSGDQNEEDLEEKIQNLREEATSVDKEKKSTYEYLYNDHQADYSGKNKKW